MRRLLMLLAIGTTALVSGCSGRVHSGYAVTASYSQPDLAYVSPGVYVVQDYHEPVFYSNNAYWRYHNNGWYRSNRYDRGWTYYRTPPRAVVSIQRPYAYVRYRPSQRYQVNRNRNNQPQGGVQVRDHRRYR